MGYMASWQAWSNYQHDLRGPRWWESGREAWLLTVMWSLTQLQDLGSACSDLVQLEENSQDPPTCRTWHKEYDLGNQSKPKSPYLEASVPSGKMKYLQLKGIRKLK